MIEVWLGAESQPVYHVFLIKGNDKCSVFKEALKKAKELSEEGWDVHVDAVVIDGEKVPMTLEDLEKEVESC